MSEGYKNNFEDQVRQGELVQLREGFRLDSVLNPDTTYRVLRIEHHDDEGGDAAWVGPQNMPQQDIADFQPELAAERRQDRYKEVSAIAIRHLQRVTLH